MVLQNGALSHLDHLVQKSIRYRHHKENYVKSLNEGIIPTGLKIKKRPALLPFQKILKESGIRFCMMQKRTL